MWVARRRAVQYGLCRFFTFKESPFRYVGFCQILEPVGLFTERQAAQRESKRTVALLTGDRDFESGFLQRRESGANSIDQPTRTEWLNLCRRRVPYWDGLPVRDPRDQRSVDPPSVRAACSERFETCCTHQ
jgi:hypothetical protein